MADETIHSLLIAVEDGDPLIPDNDDEMLAQELQLQEVLVATSFCQGTLEEGETSGSYIYNLIIYSLYI